MKTVSKLLIISTTLVVTSITGCEVPSVHITFSSNTSTGSTTNSTTTANGSTNATATNNTTHASQTPADRSFYNALKDADSKLASVSDSFTNANELAFLKSEVDSAYSSLPAPTQWDLQSQTDFDFLISLYNLQNLAILNGKDVPQDLIAKINEYINKVQTDIDQYPGDTSPAAVH